MARILYVEDNAALREAVAELLAAPGREIRACVSAEEALQAGPADLLITDISLPGLSGIELGRRLRDEGRCTRVVLCSGLGLDDMAQALGEGVVVLAKPFDIDQLEAIVRAQLAPAGG